MKSVNKMEYPKIEKNEPSFTSSCTLHGPGHMNLRVLAASSDVFPPSSFFHVLA